MPQTKNNHMGNKNKMPQSSMWISINRGKAFDRSLFPRKD